MKELFLIETGLPMSSLYQQTIELPSRETSGHCEELLMVFRRMKNVPPIDSSRDQVIKPSLDLYPRFPRHLSDPSTKNRQNSRPDPDRHFFALVPYE